MALYRNTLTIPSTGGATDANLNTLPDFIFNNITSQSMAPVTVIKSSPGGNSALSSYVLKIANSGHYLSISFTTSSQFTIGVYNLAYSSTLSSVTINFSIGDNIINNILTTSNLLSFSILDVNSANVLCIAYFNTNNNNWCVSLGGASPIYLPNSDSSVSSLQSFGYCASTDTYIVTPALLSNSGSFSLLSLTGDVPIPIVAFSSSSNIPGLSNGHAYTGAGLNWLYSQYMICADNA